MRNRNLCLLLSFALACGAAFAQSGVKTPAGASQKQATGQQRAGFDMKAIDKSVDPCDNFYQFACGSWLKNNPIPADQSRWGRFTELQERNERNMRDILETSAAKTTRTPVEQKIGDYFASCMDEKGVESRGVAPLKPVLDRIAALSGTEELTGELIRLHTEAIPAIFNI